MSDQIQSLAQRARSSSFVLMNASTGVKNHFLFALAERLENEKDAILRENQRDVETALLSGMKSAFIDRLLLHEKRIEEMSLGLRRVAGLPDPVGEVLEGVRRPNGLLINKVRVPLGVLAIIFEARPNVTVDSIGLAVKSGNTVLLRGSSSTIHSNRFLVALARTALKESGLPEDAVSLVESTSHEDVKTLLSLREYIDVAIPRGGAHLIQNVVEHSLIPVIETGVGNCHVYVDDPADLVMAERIILNAKTQRPSVCNAAETLLVHQAVAPVFLPLVITALREKGVEIRGCDMVKRYVPDVIPATEEDWVTEYLDLILAVKVVPDLAEAIRHINQYGTRHSEAIVTRDYTHAQEFLARIDAAVVYVNASTRFTDGEQFGMGAEIGISTQKLHARGPMGLRELTTTKFVVYGSGQVRE